MNYGENQYDLREVGVKLKNTLTKEFNENNFSGPGLSQKEC